MFSTNNLCYDLEGLFIINICLTTIIITTATTTTTTKTLFCNGFDSSVRAFYVEKRKDEKKNDQTLKN